MSTPAPIKQSSGKPKCWSKKFDEMSDKEVIDLLNLVDGERIPNEWFEQLFSQLDKRGIEY